MYSHDYEIRRLWSSNNHLRQLETFPDIMEIGNPAIEMMEYIFMNHSESERKIQKSIEIIQTKEKLNLNMYHRQLHRL